MTMTSLIPPNAPTILPGGQQVVGGQTSKPQTGTTPIPKTARGSGVYGGPGSAPPQPGPIRDYVVILRNESSDNFRMRYLTVEYVIAAYDELVVPWEVMVSFMGSPEVQNLGPRRMDRRNVYEKLRVKYGAYYDDELWEQNKPKLSAWRVTGDRLTTVIDDPDGLAITPSQVSQQEAAATATQIAILQQQLEATTRLVTQLTGQANSTGMTPPVPSDAVIAPPQDAPLQAEWSPDDVNMDEGDTAVREGSNVENAIPLNTRPVPPVTHTTITPPTLPNPVAGMTPQMPPTQTQVFADDEDNSGAGQGATPDMPTNPIKIG